MAAGSVIKAVEDLIAGLTAANFPNGVIPPVFFNTAPQEGTTGAQQRTPYIVLIDEGGEPEWTFGTAGTPGQNAIINGSFVLEVYYLSLGDADEAISAILWNGKAPDERAGLAFATLDLASPLVSMSVIPRADVRSYAGFNYQGSRVHKVGQDFTTQSALRGTG